MPKPALVARLLLHLFVLLALSLPPALPAPEHRSAEAAPSGPAGPVSVPPPALRGSAEAPMGPPSPAAQPFTLSSLARTGLPALPDWTVEGDESYAGFGSTLASAGDVNGDGFADLIVGARYYGANCGRVYVYYGSANGPSTTPDWIADGDQDEAHFGWAVGTAGDVNNDGYDDIVVGALGNPSFSAPGRVVVYYGSPAGLSPTPG